MNTLLENPLPGILIGLLAIGILGGAWIRLGRPWLLQLMAVAALLTIGSVALERYVVTYREAIDATLREGAETVERNDLNGLLAFIHPSAKSIRDRVEAEFPQYEFQKVRIARNLEIKVDADRKPPQAVATFNVLAQGTFGGGTIQNQPVVRWVKLKLELDKDGKWRVLDYEHAPPSQAFLNTSGE